MTSALQDSLKKLQASFDSSKRDSVGKATLHVGRGKSNIDLVPRLFIPFFFDIDTLATLARLFGLF